MRELKEYEVTERAGEWVAGKRRPESGRLLLTDRQAEHELRLGNIRPYEPPPPAPAPRRRARKAKG